MIADVLFDAVARIEDYIARQPDVLADFHDEIRAECVRMTALAAKLDSLPPDDE